MSRLSSDLSPLLKYNSTTEDHNIQKAAGLLDGEVKLGHDLLTFVVMLQHATDKLAAGVLAVRVVAPADVVQQPLASTVAHTHTHTNQQQHNTEQKL